MTWPTSLRYSCTSRTGFLSASKTPSAMSGLLAGAERHGRTPQAFHAVPERGGALEVQIGRRRPHVGFERREMGLERRLVRELIPLVGRHRYRQVVALVHAGHHALDVADDGFRRDVVLEVVRLLHALAPLRLLHRIPH